MPCSFWLMRRRRSVLQRREEGVKNKRLDLYNITEYFAVSAFWVLHIDGTKFTCYPFYNKLPASIAKRRQRTGC